MKNPFKLKNFFHAAYLIFYGTLIGFTLGFAQLVYAEITDLTNTPLTISSSSAVKPNTTFILDDSGSMARDFTPEYVNDSNGSGTAAGCYNSGDDGSGNITGTPDPCREGDPPWMSSDFNTQYYNPKYTYIPPVNADGTSMPSMGSPWTSVPRDGFGVQSSSLTDLITGFPDLLWCDAPSGGTCKKNADYTYPNSAFPYSRSMNGSSYYYLKVPNEYCETTSLTNCVSSTTPTGIYTTPAILRFCDSSAGTNCQARRLGNFIYPKYLGTINPGSGGVAAIAATATVQILNSGSNDSVDITTLKVDGVNIINTAITASGGTNTSSERQAVASDLCNAINSTSSTPNYQARNIGSGTTCSSTGSDTVTIEALITGPEPNGYAVTVGSNAVGTVAAEAIVIIDSAPIGAQLGGGRTIGGVAVTSGSTITASGSNSNNRRRSLRNELIDAINSYSSSPQYSAANSGSFGLTISATVAEGANANGRIVIIPAFNGAVLSITDCSLPMAGDALCGGETGGGIPTNATNLTGGADAIPPSVPFRENIGTWARTNIVATNNSYPRAPTRTDCLAATCTYAEEMTNFANWYAYYRTRMQMMKSSAGRAFIALGNDYRVGFVTLNPGDNPAGQTPSGYEHVPVSDFDTIQKANWYSRFYGIVPNSGTPLREALSRVGRYYAGITSGINASMTDDPMQYSCQQNISLLTTDGFWNGDDGDNLSGGTIGNQDNVDSGYSTRADGAYDGGLGGTTSPTSTGSSNTLADVAMYYYKTDLRPDGSTGALGTDVGTDNNVPATGKDDAPHQHMTTFALAFGIDGLMNYKQDYETALTGDYANIVSGASNCLWASGVICNWPQVMGDDPSTLDDLWHTAVNGRGKYFNAKDPSGLFQGITNALSTTAIRTGSAAASSTSSPNITQTDRFIYSSTYRTQVWDGEIVAQQIDTTDGSIDPTILWSAQTLLDDKIDTASDTRTIYIFDSGGTNKLKAFKDATLTASEKAYFTNQVCATTTPSVSPPEPLIQCTLGMPDVDKVAANLSLNMISYLRGQTGKEGPLYRAREHTLGDTVNSTPAYVRIPSFSFSDTGYLTFKSAQSTRAPSLYVAANDGMLHAFHGNTGDEKWAFIPKSIFPTMYKLAATDYANNHRFYVDGSPATMDVFDTSTSAWKTIVVGGLNSGGRGYYALDVTDPVTPKGLWEFCTDSTLCTTTDSDLGFTHGNPVITKRASDGKWVVLVTSGYNNVPDTNDLYPDTGNGKGYLYVLDAISGALLQKIDTGAGDTSTPVGLAKIAAYADDAGSNNTTKWVYGGDLQGNVWRFDLTVSPATVMRLATLKDGSSPPRPQSITTRPELAVKGSSPLIMIGTGRYLGTNDLPDGATLSPVLPYAYENSMYAFKDTLTDLGNLRIRSDIQSRTLSTTSETTRTTTNSPVMNWATKIGWYVDFNPANASPGERLNVDPQLILGTLIFATNVPGSSACSIGGESWLYQLNYMEGTFVTTAANAVAATKSNNATVGFVVIQLPSGAIKIIKTESTGAKATTGANMGSGSNSGRRVSWRELVN